MKIVYMGDHSKLKLGALADRTRNFQKDIRSEDAMDKKSLKETGLGHKKLKSLSVSVLEFFCN